MFSSPKNLSKPTQTEISERRGDTVDIPGDYQFRARKSGFVVQRYWHYEKERVVRKFCAPTRGDFAVDVGCGSGIVASLVASLGARVSGIDANPAAVEFARREFRTAGLEFRLGQVDDLPFPDASVDLAYCMEVIEHLYEPQVNWLLARLHTVVKPGGRILLTTPNYHGLWPLLEFTLDRLHLVQRLQGDQHVSRYNRRKLYAALAGAGWKIERLTTFSTAAPFLSVFGWGLARAVSALEDRCDLPFGNVLLAIARRT